MVTPTALVGLGLPHRMALKPRHMSLDLQQGHLVSCTAHKPIRLRSSASTDSHERHVNVSTISVATQHLLTLWNLRKAQLPSNAVLASGEAAFFTAITEQLQDRQRKEMNQKEFDKTNGLTTQPPRTFNGMRKKASRALKKKLCTQKGLLSLLYSRLPVVKWLQHYKQDNLLPDVAAGVTLAIYNVPQSMAYANLAGLPPVYGLYAAFFPPLIYFLLGTSNHISIGVFSLTSIMTGQARSAILPNDANGTAATDFEGLTDLTPIDVVVVLSFLTGVIQVIMWLLHLSFLSTYLSDSVVSGLTFGAAIHAFVAQLSGLLGIRLGRTNQGVFQLLSKVKGLAVALPGTNIATLIISIVTISFLVAFKHLVDPILKKRKIPVPSELVVLIATTIISWCANLQERFNVKVVGEVPIGLPAPHIPLLEPALVKHLLVPAAGIAVVAYAVTVSMGKLFARKHKYEIDTDQEMLALGLAGSISSFFSVFPSSTSLSRSLVNEGAGARTQVSGFIAASVVLCVILVIAPLLEALPMCVLNSIVVVALSSLIAKVTELGTLWRFSKLDVVVYVVTAVVTICWNIIEGLVSGVVVALLTVVVHTQRPSIALLGEVGKSEYRSVVTYSQAKRTNIPIVRFDSPVIFTNVELLKSYVRNVVENETEVKEKSGENLAMAPNLKAVILDCNSWCYTDAMGIEAIKEAWQRHGNTTSTASYRKKTFFRFETVSYKNIFERQQATLQPYKAYALLEAVQNSFTRKLWTGLNEELRTRRVVLILANLKPNIRLQYAQAGLLKSFHEDQFCPSIEDALSIAQRCSSCAFTQFKKDDNVVVL